MAGASDVKAQANAIANAMVGSGAGALVGTGLAAWRVLRCNPWCHGGCDEVPDTMPWERPRVSPSGGLFTSLLERESGRVPAAAVPQPAATDKTNLSNP